MSTDKVVEIRLTDWLRVIRMLAIHESHIANLFRQTHGMKEFKYDDILKEMAEDFEVGYEDTRDVKFARFKHDKSTIKDD